MIRSFQIDFEPQNRRKNDEISTENRKKNAPELPGVYERLPGGSRRRSDASPHAPGGAPGAPGAPPGRPKWCQKRRKIDARSVPGCPPDNESRKSAKNNLDHCSFIVDFGSQKRQKIDEIPKPFSCLFSSRFLIVFCDEKRSRIDRQIDVKSILEPPLTRHGDFSKIFVFSR